MADLMRRLLKVQKGEEAKVFLFVLLSALLQAGLAVGMSAADSLFLVKVGAGQLPYVFLIMPCMMLVYISIYSYLMGRYGIDRVFDFTLVLVTAGGIGLYFLLQVSHPAVYYVVKLYAGLWYIGLYTLFCSGCSCSGQHRPSSSSPWRSSCAGSAPGLRRMRRSTRKALSRRSATRAASCAARPTCVS